MLRTLRLLIIVSGFDLGRLLRCLEQSILYHLGFWSNTTRRIPPSFIGQRSGASPTWS